MKNSRHLFTTAETAGRLRTSKGALANWRCNGEGPPYLKIGKRILYDSRDLDEWLERRKVKTVDTIPEKGGEF